MSKKEDYFWSILRIAMGWLFLWPFFDKLFGLGFGTAPESAWLTGASPTSGFLQYATKGPFAEMFQSLAGSVVVDWLFMMGLLLIGVALILGVGVRIAGYSGVLMMVLMFLAASIPPEHNPILDEHVIYAIILIGYTIVPSRGVCILGDKWSKTNIVKKYPILQ